VQVHVVAGITAVQALTAAHALAVNEIGQPFTVTTGRQLRDHGWPAGVDTVVVMLDGQCSFTHLPPALAQDVDIWWGAYVGMAQQVLDHGPLAEAGPRILATRAAARAQHGWIMDIYLLRRRSAAAPATAFNA
jgi:precorrin-6A synthase